nr:nucleotide-binding alpha-beta plait domain-containing protein [Tanacetum cinerariifolium]
MWDENIESHGRITWLEIKGIPAVIWDSNTAWKIRERLGSVLDVDDMDIRHDISNSVGVLIHTKNMGEINKCIPLKVNGRIYHVRIFEDHNRSTLLNNPDDSDKVARNTKEAPFDDDHREVVKNDEFDSSSHVSPTYEEAAREAKKAKPKRNIKKTLVFGKSLIVQDLQLINESSLSGPTTEIKDEIRRALGLVYDDVYQEVAKEQESSS